MASLSEMHFSLLAFFSTFFLELYNFYTIFPVELKELTLKESSFLLVIKFTITCLRCEQFTERNNKHLKVKQAR